MKVKVLRMDCIDSPEGSLSTDDDLSEDDDEDNDDQTLEVDSDKLQISNDEPDNEIEERTLIALSKRRFMMWIVLNHLRLQCQIGKDLKS